jgi:hypothetical protein
MTEATGKPSKKRKSRTRTGETVAIGETLPLGIDAGLLTTPKPVKAAFGAVNRKKLIDAVFANPVYAGDPIWKSVYRMLLWVDSTTGLGHCYESDKSQPGKNWYTRALAFHQWLATEFGVPPSEVAGQIDQLFNSATEQLVAYVLSGREKLLQKAASQRAPYDGKGFPEPGEDPELVAIVREVLGPNLTSDPSPAQWKLLVERLRQHVTLENKRKNLVGEGFEDVLAAVASKVLTPAGFEVKARHVLQTIYGFEHKDSNDKVNKADLAITRRSDNRRLLVTAKWSIRADREKQFSQEYQSYVKANSVNLPWHFVLITNEFDPARLMRSCEALQGAHFMFEKVVHISPDGLLAAYGQNGEASMQRVRGYIENKRLISLSAWLEGLASA